MQDQICVSLQDLVSPQSVAVTSRPRSVFGYVLDATIRDEPDQGHQNVDRI